MEKKNLKFLNIIKIIWLFLLWEPSYLFLIIIIIILISTDLNSEMFSDLNWPYKTNL